MHRCQGSLEMELRTFKYGSFSAEMAHLGDAPSPTASKAAPNHRAIKLANETAVADATARIAAAPPFGDYLQRGIKVRMR
jgi:hypothetical protein